MQHLKQFCLVTGALFVPLFPFKNVSHLKTASAALSLATKTILMERVATHEMNGREIQSILTLNTVIA